MEPKAEGPVAAYMQRFYTKEQWETAERAHQQRCDELVEAQEKRRKGFRGLPEWAQELIVFGLALLLCLAVALLAGCSKPKPITITTHPQIRFEDEDCDSMPCGVRALQSVAERHKLNWIVEDNHTDFYMSRYCAGAGKEISGSVKYIFWNCGDTAGVAAKETANDIITDNEYLTKTASTPLWGTEVPGRGAVKP